MSRLDDAIDADDQPKRGSKCRHTRVRASFADPADLARFDELVTEVTAGLRTATSVSRILERVGISYTANNLNHHLRGDCACPRDNRP